MLSYRHSFHAGNHADVLKHIVETLILQNLCQKDKPFLYLDTHAGAGRYHLIAEHAIKNGEFLTGIAPLWQRQDIPNAAQHYFNIVRRYNRGKTLTFYPGSPLIAKQLLRPQDKFILCELHSTDFLLLQQEFKHDNRTTLLKQNGYQQLKAKLPPPSRRGLILIDPSYEIKSDYEVSIQSIQEGYKRFATGCYMLWYPVIFRQQIKRLTTQLIATAIPNILQLELNVKNDNSHRGMTGSGVMIVNPPWKLDTQMQSVLPWLHQHLSFNGEGTTLCQWLS